MTDKDSGKWFKGTAVGGFRRQDVIAYIESLLREHKEEIESYRTGAETLRKERDEARTQLLRLQGQMGQISETQSEAPLLRDQVASLTTALAREKEISQGLLQASAQSDAQLKAALQAVTDWQASFEAHNARWERQEAELAELRGKLAELGNKMAEQADAQMRAGEAEQDIQRRAEVFKREFSESMRETLVKLMSDVRSRAASARREAERSVQSLDADMSRIFEMFSSIDGLFTGLESRLGALNLPGAPDAAREEAPAAADVPAADESMAHAEPVSSYVPPPAAPSIDTPAYPPAQPYAENTPAYPPAQPYAENAPAYPPAQPYVENAPAHPPAQPYAEPLRTYAPPPAPPPVGAPNYGPPAYPYAQSYAENAPAYPPAPPAAEPLPQADPPPAAQPGYARGPLAHFEIPRPPSQNPPAQSDGLGQAPPPPPPAPRPFVLPSFDDLKSPFDHS